MFFIERKSNFRSKWEISVGWSGSGGYASREEAEVWLERARWHNLECIQATSWEFRIVEREVTI